MENTLNSCIMIIFGATGDLTHRKLMPALYYLNKEKRLPEDFDIVAVGRRELTTEGYVSDIKGKIIDSISDKTDENALDDMLLKVTYHKQDLSDSEGYKSLKALTEKLGADKNILYYLAVAPQFFDTIVEKLAEQDMAYQKEPWRRIVIEKPFGHDLHSAEELNRRITKVFPESSIYRIDHYLGKEMLQNLVTIRFANAVFEPIWNNRYIDNVQISSSEKLGVETRGGYYENSGILRDMVQNHMLQLLTLTAMEPPATFDERHIRDAKLEVLKKIVEDAHAVKAVSGQYGKGVMDGREVPGYRQEDKVSPDSKTATFAAIKLMINNDRWRGVPFYIRTGKRMPEKTTQVVIQFRNDLRYVDYKKSDDLKPNLLVIKIHPSEGVEFKFNTKVPRTINEFEQVHMDYCQSCRTDIMSPEAYERLLHDAIRGDATLFTRWDEVKYSWVFTDRIHAEWAKEDADFPNYASGTWGPSAAEELLQKDGRNWWP